ncbi:MAG: HlyD family type I secretion periplasmic adaptor subunit [Pseudomonadota bacterium]
MNHKQGHQAAPPPPAFFIRLATSVIVSVFGGLALWSITAPIDGAVLASGQVVVETNRKAVQHLEGGVIGEILVREGDAVRQGETVARLDDTVQRANVALIEGQLTELYARRARLEAERDEGEDLAQPRGIATVMSSSAFAEKLKGQRTLLVARQQTRQKQLALLEEGIVQQNERIAGLNARISSLQEQIRLFREELSGALELREKGYVPATRVRELERDTKALEGDRSALEASVAEARSRIAEARLEVERLFDAGREEAISELRDLDVSIAELEERRITAMDALERTAIKAPQSGRVLGLAVHTIGGVVPPGAPLMEIVPGDDHLLVAARVAPKDVDKVRDGQETLVRFSALGTRVTPETSGAVRSVSADSMTDEVTGVPFYLVMIDIPGGEELQSLLGEQTLVPGMPVETFIRTGSRPAISYLLRPLTDSLARSMREE